MDYFVGDSLYYLYPGFYVVVIWSPEASLSAPHRVNVITQPGLPRRIEGGIKVDTAGRQLVVPD